MLSAGEAGGAAETCCWDAGRRRRVGVVWRRRDEEEYGEERMASFCEFELGDGYVSLQVASRDRAKQFEE